MKIGFLKHKYPEQRNIIHKARGAVYVKVRNYKLILINILNTISLKILKKRGFEDDRFRFYFNDFGINKVDVIHLFNDISYGTSPWVVSFETVVPRFNESNRLVHAPKNDTDLKGHKSTYKALKALSGSSCKKIIALSECNLQMQKTFLSHFPEYYKKIVPKLVCLHPPQKVLVNSWDEKSISITGDIHFMFVGGQFFGKGGREILEVFQELRKEKGYHLKLTIISSLQTDTYASNTSVKDVALALSSIEANKDWIRHHHYLPNNEVIEIMKSAHVGLLPTYADTYGYSVLEFQACGCPVITTNVRALPEINNNAIGWLIPVKKHASGEGYYASDDERKGMSKLIKAGLKNAVLEIMEHKALPITKGNGALKHIRENHSPEVFEEKLTKIYLEALE
jgi:glycosyltransferase involved in cell wall biosynthesis